MRYAASKEHLSIGNTIYPRPNQRAKDQNYLGHGKDVWFGYHQSVRPCEWKQFTLNIDQHVTAFYRECSLIDFCAEYFEASPSDVESGLQEKKYRDEFEKEIKGLIFTSNYETLAGKNMRYKINGLDQDPTTATFEKDGTTISIADYFTNHLNEPIMQPRLPCVRVGSEKSGRKKLFPMEKCFLVNDQKVKKLGENDVATIIKKAVKPG